MIKGECWELLFSDQLWINPRGDFSPFSLFHTCNRPHGPYIYTHNVHWEYNRESFASLDHSHSLFSNRYLGWRVITIDHHDFMRDNLVFLMARPFIWEIITIIQMAHGNNWDNRLPNFVTIYDAIVMRNENENNNHWSYAIIESPIFFRREGWLILNLGIVHPQITHEKSKIKKIHNILSTLFHRLFP